MFEIDVSRRFCKYQHENVNININVNVVMPINFFSKYLNRHIQRNYAFENKRLFGIHVNLRLLI
jgi:hypothetical protein